MVTKCYAKCLAFKGKMDAVPGAKGIVTCRDSGSCPLVSEPLPVVPYEPENIEPVPEEPVYEIPSVPECAMPPVSACGKRKVDESYGDNVVVVYSGPGGGRGIGPPFVKVRKRVVEFLKNMNNPCLNPNPMASQQMDIQEITCPLPSNPMEVEPGGGGVDGVDGLPTDGFGGDDGVTEDDINSDWGQFPDPAPLSLGMEEGVGLCQKFQREMVDNNCQGVVGCAYRHEF